MEKISGLEKKALYGVLAQLAEKRKNRSEKKTSLVRAIIAKKRFSHLEFATRDYLAGKSRSA